MNKNYILLFLMLFGCARPIQCAENNLGKWALMTIAGISCCYVAKKAYQRWQANRELRHRNFVRFLVDNEDLLYREDIFGRLLFMFSDEEPEKIINFLASGTHQIKMRMELPTQQYKINMQGETKINSLEDMAIINIIARDSIEEIVQCHPHILCNYTHYLSFKQIKEIIAYLHNENLFSEEYARQMTRNFVNACCKDQAKYILSLLKHNSYNPFMRQLSENKEFAEFPQELQEAICTKIVHELELQPAE